MQAWRAQYTTALVGQLDSTIDPAPASAPVPACATCPVTWVAWLILGVALLALAIYLKK